MGERGKLERRTEKRKEMEKGREGSPRPGFETVRQRERTA